MPRNVAIAIGVNHYQYENSLQFAGNDAKAMRSYLQGIGFEEVLLYTDDEEGYHPELTNLIIGLDRISSTVRLEKDDSLWFFFSGHGGRQGGKDFLLPTNGYSQNLERTAIAIEDVIRALRECGAGNLVMILDACRNVIPDYGRGSSQTIELVKQAGIITFFSCEPNQKSYELPDLKQGAFTYSLLQALKGECHPSRCNAKELSQYLRDTVPNLVAERLKERQNPYLIAEPWEKGTQMLLPVMTQQEPPQPQVNIPVEPHLSSSGKSGGNTNALIRNAVQVTQRQEWEEAKQLWEQVLIEAHDPEDRKWALEQRDYVAAQQIQRVEIVSPPKEEVKSKSGSNVARETQPKSFVEDLGNGVKLEMILIPKGSFMMGSPHSDSYARVSEKPQHRVEIMQEFYMGKFAVTQAQYEAVMGTNPAKFKKGGLFPVEMVDWNDAKAFCNKLSKRSGKQYRLPSEAEWEYACRAGTKTRYYFGETLTKQQANWMGDSGVDAGIALAKWLTPGLAGTKKVGQYAPNDFGLYDMHGNVWEWCEDSWENNYQQARTQKPFVNSSNQKVRRGGSWHNYPRNCRSAYRYYSSRDFRINNIGFRVVCSLPG